MKISVCYNQGQAVVATRQKLQLIDCRSLATLVLAGFRPTRIDMAALAAAYLGEVSAAPEVPTLSKTDNPQPLFGLWNKNRHAWLRDAAGTVILYTQAQATPWLAQDPTWEAKEVLSCALEDCHDVTNPLAGGGAPAPQSSSPQGGSHAR